MAYGSLAPQEAREPNPDEGGRQIMEAYGMVLALAIMLFFIIVTLTNQG